MDLRLAGTLVVALATLCASVKVVPTECPKHDLPNHPVHLAHDSDCGKFYKCGRGKKIVIDCPVYNEEGDRLHFNATLQFCDLPENVDCKLHQQIAAIPYTVDIPIECPKRNLPNLPVVHLAHENDCTKFYKCDWGEKVLFDCPVYNEENDRLYFNPNIQVCDWPDKVNCEMPPPDGNPTTSTDPSPTPGENPTNGTDPLPTPGGNPTTSTDPLPIEGCIGTCPFQAKDAYPDRLPHKDCKKFCLCSDYGAEVHDCPPDRPHWDDYDKRCATAEETPCSTEGDDVLMNISRFRDRFIW